MRESGDLYVQIDMQECLLSTCRGCLAVKKIVDPFDRGLLCVSLGLVLALHHSRHPWVGYFHLISRIRALGSLNPKPSPGINNLTLEPFQAHVSVVVSFVEFAFALLQLFMRTMFLHTLCRYIYMHSYTYIYICMLIHSFIHQCTHIHTYTHTSIHTYIRSLGP